MMSSKRFWVAWSLAMALVLALLAWGISHWNLNNYAAAVGDRLQLLSELRRGAMQQYFATASAELKFWSTNREVLGTQDGFRAYWHTASGGAVRSQYIDRNPHPAGELRNLDAAEDGSTYSALHGRLHPLAKMFVTRRGYYDFFLIGPEGDVYYSVEKEDDFGSNLREGPWRDSGLADAYRRAWAGRADNAVVITDMQPYGPSDDAPAIFLATALRGADGSYPGVIAFQLPTSHILEIMAYTSGMGETGETYLVGQDGLMRSDSRFSEISTVLRQQVDTVTAGRALAGEEGVDYTVDYRGVEVLSAYSVMSVGETRWAVMAEIDRDEVVTGAAGERPRMAGIFALVYGLGLWSVWYWRGRRLPDEQAVELSGLDIDSSDGGADGIVG